MFDSADGEQVFVGVVSDSQWRSFCREFGLDALAADETLAANIARVRARERLMPELRALFASLPKAEILARCEAAGLPFAPITRPDELVDDPHLRASEGLVRVSAAEGTPADLPALPLRMDARRPGVRHDVPRAGEHSREILEQMLGLHADEIAGLERAGAVA